MTLIIKKTHDQKENLETLWTHLETANIIPYSKILKVLLNFTKHIKKTLTFIKLY